MGRYMTVVLKKAHQNDLFMDVLNRQLTERYGSNTGIKFNTLQFLKEEADFMNTDPEGMKQLPDWKRPITAMQLHRNFFWLRLGTFSFKLSGCPDADEARDAVAVSKWITCTKGKFLDRRSSEDYDPVIVSEYLNHLFEEAGYDISLLWAMPE